MKYGVDFTVEPLSKRCHGQKRTVKPSSKSKDVMDSVKSFKNSPELRNYWRVHKQKQRAKTKEGKRFE